jgi:hypothetical protein
MNLALNLSMPNLMQVPIYVIIGFLMSLLVGIVGRVHTIRGAFTMMLFATFGAWLVTGMLGVHLGQDVDAMDVPLLSAFIGSFLFAVLSLFFQPRRHRELAARSKQVEVS